MKKFFTLMAFGLISTAFLSCEKETIKPSTVNKEQLNVSIKTTPSPCLSRGCSGFKFAFMGEYEQVGFYSDLFNVWSYTSSGPIETVTNDSIIGAGWTTTYMVTSVGNIYVGSPYNDYASVSFLTGDTILIDFANLSDKVKWIPN